MPVLGTNGDIFYVDNENGMVESYQVMNRRGKILPCDTLMPSCFLNGIKDGRIKPTEFFLDNAECYVED